MKDDDEMNTDDKEIDMNNNEIDINDDEINTEDDKKNNKIDYKMKAFDRYYIKLDHSDHRNDNIIYINTSKASYDALKFFKYYEQHSNEVGILCITLQIKK